MQNSRNFIFLIVLFILCTISTIFSQERMILIPEKVANSELTYIDSTNTFRNMIIFLEDGDVKNAADSLKKVLVDAGLNIKKNFYYIVVVNYDKKHNIIGMFHKNNSFLSTRLYGLKSDSLYYVFVTDDSTMETSISAIVTRKESNFSKNLSGFLSLFQLGDIFSVKPMEFRERKAFISIRKFDVPQKFQKYCDITVVAKDESKNKELVRSIFDNTSLERWSYGIATAVTNVNDIDYDIEDGAVTIKPKPKGDLASFGVINYHFKPVDTKSRTFSSSVHLLGGLRVSTTIEPILGIGAGVPVSLINLHFFAGYSLEFAQILKEGIKVGEIVKSSTDPFKLKVRGKPRFGVEVNFP